MFYHRDVRICSQFCCKAYQVVFSANKCIDYYIFRLEHISHLKLHITVCTNRNGDLCWVLSNFVGHFCHIMHLNASFYYF